MAANDLIEIEGTVTQINRGCFIVEPDPPAKGPITAKLAGKIRQNNIRIVVGDRVRVEVSPYQLDLGRLIRRL